MSEPKSKRRDRHAVKEHLPRWTLDLAAEADEILAAAPYVTEGRLFKKCDPKLARLYTAFNALNFISGASSLRTLKALLGKGVAIYHVDFLHAKVVLINGVTFSIGSQNLTVRGRRTNIEASFVAGSDTPSKEVRDFFERIHKNARPISMQDIAEMEKLVEPWMKKFKEIEQAADGIDRHLELKREYREKVRRRMREALERQRLEELERAKRVAEELAKLEIEKQAANEHSERMKRALLEFNKIFARPTGTPAIRIRAAVERVTNKSNTIFGIDKTTTESLLPLDREQNYENLLKSIGITPKRFSRYLIVNVDDGKLGLVRFAKTRWTFFGEEFTLPKYSVLVG